MWRQWPGVKPAQERADLIAYLRTLSDHPLPLPQRAKEAPAGPRYGGLPAGEGREAVYFTCRACHSLDQFTGHHLSREGWDETLDWMVEEQGMDEISDLALRDLILDYLSTHFGSG